MFVRWAARYVEPPPDSPQPHKVACVDGTGGRVDLVFFRKTTEGWRKVADSLPLGAPRVVSGLVKPGFGRTDLFQPRPPTAHSGAADGRADLQVVSRLKKMSTPNLFLFRRRAPFFPLSHIYLSSVHSMRALLLFFRQGVWEPGL